MIYEIKSFDKKGINKICLKFSDLLDKLGYGDLSKSLHYVIRELVHNAVKANMKRVFIAENQYIRQERHSRRVSQCPKLPSRCIN